MLFKKWWKEALVFTEFGRIYSDMSAMWISRISGIVPDWPNKINLAVVVIPEDSAHKITKE